MSSNNKKELLVEYELEFLEEKLKELKEYISANPFSSLDDRLALSGTRNFKDGSTQDSYRVVATKEAQRKDLTQALKDYAEIVRTVEQMRTHEAKKVKVRGDEELGDQASEFLKSKSKA